MIIISITCLAAIAYCLYQLRRNEQVFKVREKWIKDHDYRWDKYSYDFMMGPKKHNWFGFKWPKDSHYK